MATRQARRLGTWALAPSVTALSAWAFIPLALAIYFAFLRYIASDRRGSRCQTSSSQVRT